MIIEQPPPVRRQPIEEDSRERSATIKPAAPVPVEVSSYLIYEFVDDVLAFAGFGPCDAAIRLRPPTVRAPVRIRLNFIPALLRDIEAL